MTPEQELKEIQRQFTIQSIIDAPGCLLLGLGLYAKFEAKGDAFHPLLNDSNVVNGMLFVGALILAYSAVKLFKLAKRQKEIEKQTAT